MDRQPTAPSSDRHPPSPTNAEQIALRGPSNLPDPLYHAYRRDLADRAIASQVISSHYADAVDLELATATELRAAPAEEGDILTSLSAGEGFRMLDNKLGWAWGYCADGRVGYVQAKSLELS